MYKEYLAPIVKVTCKHFLNLDESFFVSAKVVAISFISMLTVLFLNAVLFFHDGWLTVKSDAAYIKSNLVEYKHHFVTENGKVSLIQGIRSLKHNRISRQYASHS
ncbi:MAG: hypothetical protein V4649_19265 [Bacteroidota bacterium]